MSSTYTITKDMPYTLDQLQGFINDMEALGVPSDTTISLRQVDGFLGTKSYKINVKINMEKVTGKSIGRHYQFTAEGMTIDSEAFETELKKRERIRQRTEDFNNENPYY